MLTAPLLASLALADVRGRPVAVVRQAVDDDADAARGVGLVGELLHDLAFELTRALLDGPLDVVAGHVHVAGGVDGCAQPGVGLDVGAAQLGGQDDLLAQAREDPALLGVDLGLLMLDAGPLAVSGHRGS
jgi:hypothetical protein